MQLGGTSGTIYRVSEWLMRLAFLNVLWFVFTLIGLGLFGFYPALIAACRMLGEWKCGRNPRYLKTFVSVYKQVFLRANSVALPALFVTGVILFNLLIIQNFDGFIYYFFAISTFLMLLFLWCWLAVLAVVIGSSEARLTFGRKELKEAMVQMLHAPLKLAALAFTLIVVYLTILYIPGIVPFYSVSILAWAAVSLFSKA
ncbi:hypothetical protein CR205_10415 [Alteribacter lacisalsi]|uniref:DUF624 domain-containing protein n=1 Tax=Alteribacter lacisalsi TaxID=2045244 RepID=A0A2W0HCP0_9BACI|nr:DUF624 domain-containing protein [Alteribacter lacisalsi]PYZ98957.1 hypothetical protein CR205_10415 [Alteribacter lacisalsi]